MDECTRYVAVEFWFDEDVDDVYEVLVELEDHLRMNEYDFYMWKVPECEQIFVLLINEEQIEYIDTVLEDRNINYRYTLK